MRAAVFAGPPGSWPERPLVIEERPCPQAGAGEVLVRVAACGLCHTDLEYLHEGMRPPKEPPLVLGHEVSGTVAGTGAGVSGLQEGQKVVLAFTHPCGSCFHCRRGRENLCPEADILGASRDGGLAEYVVVPAASVFLLPEGAPLQESALLTDAFATSYHALVDLGRVQPGDTLAIYGASGGLGLSAVQIGAALGATVIAVGRQRWKLERALEMGAAAVVSTLNTDQPEKEVNHLTGGGADISLDATGVPEMISAACRSTRPSGKLVVMGYGLRRFEVPLHRLVWMQLSILGARTYRPADLSHVLAMLEKGMIDPRPIASHRFALEEVNEGYRMLANGKVLRALVTP